MESRRKPLKSKKHNSEQLFQYALRSLAGRALSESELRTKLKAKAEDPADVDRVVLRLREYNFVDDRKFAESYAGARKDSGSFGSQRVMRDLRQKRVETAIAEKAVEQAFEGSDETDLVRNWLSRKFRSVALSEYLQDPKHVASAYRKLRYAGFSSSASIKVLREFADCADDLEEGIE